MEERIYLSEDLDTGRAVFVPDVLIHPKLGNLPGTADLADTTTMEISGPIDLDDLFEEIHEPYVTIIDRAGRSVVAIIEVLSPSNKVANSSGRASFFLATRREIFASNSHWIEIDLLRAGELSPGSRAALPQHEYAVYLSKAGEKRRHNLIWTVRLNQRLPTIAIPLLGGDPDAPLDLQQVLTTAFARAGYEADIDYTTDPVPPLDPEFRSWADRLLKEKGVR